MKFNKLTIFPGSELALPGQILCSLLKVAVLILALSGQIQAREVLHGQVMKQGEVFSTWFEVSLNAPAANVRKVLSDMNQLVPLLPDVKTYDIKHGSRRNAEVEMVMETCVLILCKEFVQKQRFYISKNGTLKGRFVESGSDFETGDSYYEVVEDRNGIRLRFVSNLEPKFWVPFGEQRLTNCLMDYAQKLAIAIEQHVQSQFMHAARKKQGLEKPA